MDVEEITPTQEEPQMTLTLSHDAAVAVAAASMYYRTWFQPNLEMAPTLKQLDEVVAFIMQQPLTDPARAMLHDMQLVTGALEEVEEQSQWM
jgi:hypothetical protein